MADKDINGLPDVDLGPIIKDLETQKDKEPEKPKETETELDLGQFRNPKDMLKSYKEIQGAFTKVSQENKALKEAAEKAQQLEHELAALREQQELARYQPQQPQQFSQQKKFDDLWMEDPENALRQKVMEQVNLTRINEVLQEEDMKNHDEFQERYAYVNMLSQNPQYAPLANTAAGVKKLFDIADKLRVEQLKKNSRKSLEYVFGEPLNDEQLARLKQTVFGDKHQQNQQSNSNAYMPDTSTSTMTGQNQKQQPDYNAKLKEAANKGDVDGAIDALFEGIMAEEEK